MSHSDDLESRIEQFKALLNERHQWPCEFMFKFIVRKTQVEQATGLFVGEKILLKESAKGNYVSLTLTITMRSADEVLEIYARAKKVPGLIAL